MNESKKLPIELSKEELEIIVYALSSTQPINRELEVLAFKLYHKLLFKLNDYKS